jgi:DMSO reductase family type II enzyme heme b subunit
MLRRSLTLNVAPPGLSPGGYVGKAYADHVSPRTTHADLEVAEKDGAWTVELSWRAAHPVRALEGDPSRFVDAAALLVPATEAAQALTMGAPTDPVEGALWRADQARPIRIAAKGWGTVERQDAPALWTTDAEWKNGLWQVRFTLGAWASLTRFRRLAVAVWQGADRERAGLKSVTPAWIALS